MISMKTARIRLIVAVTLFIGWLGYLGYLALGHAPPVIVSRSQILVAIYLVKAEIGLDDTGKPNKLVQVRESFGNLTVNLEPITIGNIAEARLPGGKPIAASGMYLLPLKRSGDQYEVVPASSGQSTDAVGRQFWIYPWNSDVERQAHELAPKGG